MLTRRLPEQQAPRFPPDRNRLAQKSRIESRIALRGNHMLRHCQASDNIALWSDLATKLTATKTVPESLEAYAKCVSERMKMAVDDGRLLADEAQQIRQKITKALGNGSKASRLTTQVSCTKVAST
jgi:hypothetical protein